MLKIKKQLPINKLYVFGALVFFTGFIGTLSVLTTIAPYAPARESAYVFDAPKADTTAVVTVEKVPEAEASQQNSGSTVQGSQTAISPTSPVVPPVTPSQTPTQTTDVPVQPTVPTTNTPIVDLPPIIDEPPVVTDPETPPVDEPTETPAGETQGVIEMIIGIL